MIRGIEISHNYYYQLLVLKIKDSHCLRKFNHVGLSTLILGIYWQEANEYCQDSISVNDDIFLLVPIRAYQHVLYRTSE